MKIYKIKNSGKKALMVTESKDWRMIGDIKTSLVTEIKTLNVVRDEDGTYKAVGDDEIEFLEEIEDGEDQ